MSKAATNQRTRIHNLRFVRDLTPDTDRKTFLSRVLEAFEKAPQSAFAGVWHAPIADWPIEDRVRAYKLYALGPLIETPAARTGVRA